MRGPARWLVLVAIVAIVVALWLRMRPIDPGDEGVAARAIGQGHAGSAQVSEEALGSPRPTADPADARTGVPAQDRSAPSTAASRPMSECLTLADPASIGACLWNADGRVPAAELASWVCNVETGTHPSAPEMVGRALHAVPLAELPDYVRSFTETCGGLAYPGDLIAHALARIEERYPGWTSSFSEQLDPGWVFASSPSTTWTRVVGLLARRGDAHCAEMIDQAARGRLDLNRFQFDEAIVHASLVDDDALRLVDLLTEALHSSALRANPDSAGMIVLTLLEPRTWPDGDARNALTLVRDALANPDIAPAVALQVLSNHAEDAAPGIDAPTWSSIWQASEAIARAKGWVVAGRAY
jgi:hypothetical protein